MSIYGNVPDEDISAVSTASDVAGRVAANLGSLLPSAWHDVAYELALDGILRDWVENGTNELDSDDEEDLTNLLKLAADLALRQPESRQDQAFRTIGRNVMQDWVDNWNSDE